MGRRYEAELLRSAIPNYFLARLAAEDVKMVLTGEGADELWAGYAYFEVRPLWLLVAVLVVCIAGVLSSFVR